ncbi:MAG TPA: hypothetical protein VK683_08840, partial [Rhizomicrobium sp.]|nr:hypothetical protein [Rhizomicrobium sp.]
EADFPVARHINENGFYVGCHQDLRQSELDYIAECVGRFFGNKRTKKPEGVALILLTDKRHPVGAADIERLPMELFARTIVVDAGLPGPVRTALEARNAMAIEATDRHPLDVARDAMDREGIDAAVIFPFNGQWDPTDIPRILMTLNLGYDMVIASRFMMGGGRKGQRGNIRSLGNRVFNLLADLLFSANLSDSFSAFRGVRRSHLASISTPGRGLTKFFSLSLEAAKRGWRIQEIPTVEVTRSTSGLIADSLATVIPALLILLREWRSRPEPGPKDRS